MKGLKCPQCGTYLNLPKKIKELDRNYGSNVSLDSVTNSGAFPWMSTITCDTCEDETVLFYVYAAGESKEVYSPALKTKVKIPRNAKGQN